MYYSGSPLAYAFDESNDRKAFLKIEIDARTPGFPLTVTPVPIEPFRKVMRLSGSFADFYSQSRFDAYAADYLEITLTDDALVANPMNLLRPKFPWLLSLRQGISRPDDNAEGNVAGDPSLIATASDRRDPLGDFVRFEELLYGFTDPAKRDLFASLIAECGDET